MGSPGELSQREVSEFGVLEDSGQPLQQFILEAKDANDELYEKEKSAVPYRTKLWHFIRILKGHPKMDGLDADAAFDLICGELKGRFPNRDPWAQVLGMSDDDYIEFLTSWEKVRFAGNQDQLEEAFQLALKIPVMPDRCTVRPNAGYQLFVSFAGYLQVLSGADQNILLPCEKVGKTIDVDQSTISRYRQLAIFDGYLEEKTPYSRPGDGGRGRATECRFRVERFQELMEFEVDPDDDHSDWVDHW